MLRTTIMTSTKLITRVAKNPFIFRPSTIKFPTHVPWAWFSSDQEPPKGFEKYKRLPKQKKSSEDVRQPKIDTDFEHKNQPKKEQKNDEKKDPEEVQNKKEQKLLNEEEQKQSKVPKVDIDFEDLKKRASQRKKKFNESSEQESKGKENKPPPPSNDDGDQQRNRLIFAMLSIGGVWFLISQLEQEQWITYTEFTKNYLQKDLIKQIAIMWDNNLQQIVAVIITKSNEQVKMKIASVDFFLDNLEKVQIEQWGRQFEQLIPVEFRHNDNNKVIDRSVNLIYMGILIFIAYALFKSTRVSIKGGKGSDVFNLGKSGARQFEQEIKVKFNDVAGLDQAKQEVKEFVDFLKKPEKYKILGARVPRGALLSGPPGTGKTMLAKACAGEAGVPFFYISGSEFVEIFVGVGAARVRDLFKQAKAKSPSIIFIDEIDAVGKRREGKIGGNDERDNTLNQLLVEMDGFGTNTNVIIMAATNMKDMLDPALLRPGRFDRTIDISLPDINGRKMIFLVHLRNIKISPNLTKEELAKRLATLTPGFSGAEIANLCNEAAILAARQEKASVETIDFEKAAERVIAGIEKKKIMTPEERKIVAFHEAGHAVVSWFLEGGHPLLKVTIVPRSKGSLGFAQYLPNESNLLRRSELIDQICCILGGRVTEEVFFDNITTGAQDDLKKAYKVAHAVVTKFGMSLQVGLVGYEEGRYIKPYGEQTNRLIDDGISKIIEECTEKTKQLVVEQKQNINKLANALLEKETLDLKNLVDILGDRPFPPKSNYKAYLEMKNIEQEMKEEDKKMEEQKKEEQQKENKKIEEEAKESQDQKEDNKSSKN